MKKGVPVARSGLPEEAHGGVPGSILPVEKPAPMRRAGKRKPNRPSQSTGKVSDGYIAAHDEIHVHHNRSRRRQIEPGERQIVPIFPRPN
ncbi:MAG TPA: hypothetical protein VJA94_18110 [Candidatus Angelobacter sp.]